MERKVYLRNKIKGYERSEVFAKSFHIKKLAENFLDKARHNLIFASATYSLSQNQTAKKAISLDPDFAAFDWVVITGYYAMYHASQGCLAKLGYKCENHTATIIAMEYFFVHRDKLLEKEYIEMFEKVMTMEEQYIQMLWKVKQRRETAQYSVSEDVGKRAAEEVLEDAKRFVQRIILLFKEMDEIKLAD
jgi:uncharacterized protein (UPF0332 family)